MRSLTAAFVSFSLLVSSTAIAQQAVPGAGGAPVPSLLAPGATPTGRPVQPKVDGKVFNSSSDLPGPTPVEEIKPASIALPKDAIEPYLLTRDVGPFMVMAKTFRGPDAERYALALVLELRRDHGLPAYVLRTKDFPMRSNIRNVPPTSPSYVRQARLTEPEKVRTYDEAAVLVGNEKSLDASEALLHKVRKIKPKCLNEIPSLFSWRQGLATAIRTTNPYVPTQDIFPGKKQDTLVSQMNSGPRSIYKCPGRYTLQVAEFSGRSVFNPSEKDPRVFENSWLKKSPLVTAAEDAERVADALAKDPEIRKTGFEPYVYHDRTSSKVLIGAFNNPADPTAVQLRDTLLRQAIPIADRSKGLVIAPANGLTDLEDPTRPMKSK